MPMSSVMEPRKNLSKEHAEIGRPLRQRSVYTSYSYDDPQELRSQRFTDPHKYYDIPPCEPWMTANIGPTFTPTPVTHNWQRPARNVKRPQIPYYPMEEGYPENWRELDLEPGIGAAVATPHGTISLRLHHRVRVDMTIDHAIRIINLKNNIVLTLNKTGSISALLHPNGRVYQYGSRVEILANDVHGNNKFAKMWYKGVSFTSEKCALVYLVDAAGTRSTADSFFEMTQDFSLPVFYTGSRRGPACLQEVIAILQSGQYWVTDEGIQNWIINGIRISQTEDGLVRVARQNNKYQLRTSPSNGTASLSTPFLHCTASMGQMSHLFVRRGERRMHYDGVSFIVRNAGHSAGFDEKNQLKVY